MTEAFSATAREEIVGESETERNEREKKSKRVNEQTKTAQK